MSKFCHNCNYEIKDNEITCPSCGQYISKNDSTHKSSNIDNKQFENYAKEYQLEEVEAIQFIQEKKTVNQIFLQAVPLLLLFIVLFIIIFLGIYLMSFGKMSLNSVEEYILFAVSLLFFLVVWAFQSLNIVITNKRILIKGNSGSIKSFYITDLYEYKMIEKLIHSRSGSYTVYYIQFDLKDNTKIKTYQIRNNLFEIRYVLDALIETNKSAEINELKSHCEVSTQKNFFLLP